MFDKPQNVTLDFYNDEINKTTAFTDNFAGHVKLSALEYKIFNYIRVGSNKVTLTLLKYGIDTKEMGSRELYLHVVADKMSVDDVAHILLIPYTRSDQFEIIFTVDDLDELEDVDIITMGEPYLLKISFV